jgi:hypothetical protein
VLREFTTSSPSFSAAAGLALVAEANGSGQEHGDARRRNRRRHLVNGVSLLAAVPGRARSLRWRDSLLHQRGDARRSGHLPPAAELARVTSY